MDYADLYPLEKIASFLRAARRRIAARAGLPMVHYDILDYLARAGEAGNTPLAVADHLGMTKGTVSQSIALLVQRGWLARSPDARDGRVMRLSLTDRSREMLGGAYAELQGLCAGFDLDHAYGRIFITILRDLAQRMEEGRAENPAVFAPAARAAS